MENEASGKARIWTNLNLWLRCVRRRGRVYLHLNFFSKFQQSHFQKLPLVLLHFQRSVQLQAEQQLRCLSYFWWSKKETLIRLIWNPEGMDFHQGYGGKVTWWESSSACLTMVAQKEVGKPWRFSRPKIKITFWWHPWFSHQILGSF